MIAFLKYVARRLALVLICLAIGILGWPGDVGAQNFVKVGEGGDSGMRRIRVTPGTSMPGAQSERPAAGEAEALFAAALAALPRYSGPAGAAAAAKAAANPFFVEFGARPAERTPYEASRAALDAAR